jgi:hypothetical protein
MVTEEDCIHALREAAQILEKSPTKAEYEDLDIPPSASTILRHCGGWNDAKEQAGLETAYSTGSRVEPKPDDVELPDGMVWEELSQDQRWHYRHTDKSSQRTLEWRQELRRWLHGIKAESDGCRECSELDPACLDFHHREATDKEMAVNKMVPYGYSKADIRAEVDKCDLLCANCHWKEHNSMPGYMADFEKTINNGRTDDVVTSEDLPAAAETTLTKEQRLRAWSYVYKRDRGCRGCGETHPICLQFHHKGDDKSMGVGAMISDSKPVDDVLSEVEKCIVLCANCHRKEHNEVPTPVDT